MWSNFYSLIMKKLIITKLPAVKKIIIHHQRRAEFLQKMIENIQLALEHWCLGLFLTRTCRSSACWSAPMSHGCRCPI